MSPEARWIPFGAEEFIDATRSNFRWEARLDPGKIGSPTVIDAYEDGHGRLQVKLGGIVPVKKITGQDADKGEIQRYLASVVFCPPMLLNHPTLEWSAVGASTLRLRDCQGPTGATVDVDLSGGRPTARLPAPAARAWSGNRPSSHHGAGQAANSATMKLCGLPLNWRWRGTCPKDRLHTSAGD